MCTHRGISYNIFFFSRKPRVFSRERGNCDRYTASNNGHVLSIRNTLTLDYAAITFAKFTALRFKKYRTRLFVYRVSVFIFYFLFIYFFFNKQTRKNISFFFVRSYLSTSDKFSSKSIIFGFDIIIRFFYFKNKSRQNLIQINIIFLRIVKKAFSHYAKKHSRGMRNCIDRSKIYSKGAFRL